MGGSSMDALVSHQVGLAAEALAALRAGEGAGAGVHRLVADQVGLGAEADPTLHCSLPFKDFDPRVGGLSNQNGG